jgi:hypothetical protein
LLHLPAVLRNDNGAELQVATVGGLCHLFIIISHQNSYYNIQVEIMSSNGLQCIPLSAKPVLHLKYYHK